MVASGIIKLIGFVIIGAILANVLRNPRGTQVLVGGVTSVFRTGLQAAGGQRVR